MPVLFSFASLLCRKNLMIASLFVAVSGTGSVLAASTPVAKAATNANEVLAKSGKVEVKRGDLTEEERTKLYEAELAVYKTIEAIASQRYVMGALAEYRTKNKMADNGTAEKSFFKSKEITDAQVKTFIDENKDNPNMAKIPEGERTKVLRGFLEGQARQDAVRAFVDKGQSTGEIQVVAMAKPVQPKIQVTDGPNNPSVGPKSAKVTIVEFTDYQCPYCVKVEPTLKEVVKKYGDKVRVVVRDFPLSFHPQAMPAAIAATCAHSQGKFFEMKDKLFAQQDKLSEELYGKIAKEIKLDTKKYEACVKDPATRADVEADMREGEKFGVNGTPALFVNGRKSSGALDIGELSKMIDEELAVN